jgi:thiol-disulfide isomerase/thioredoxin
VPEPRNSSRIHTVVQLALSLCLLWTCTHFSLHAQSTPKPATQGPSPQISSEAEEQAALNDAFRSAENNPQILIKNLEDFLARFPKSSRREIVLRTICTYAMQANMPDVAARYGQMLLEIAPDDPRLLTLLIDVLAGQKDEKSRASAIEYCSRLIAIAEKQRDQAAATGVSNNTPAQWAEEIASLYAQRGGLYRDSGDLDKATADYAKSYQTYPTARVAEQLGDAASKKNDLTRAVDYYTTAFAFPERSSNPAHQQELRRKLGSAYMALHHSQKGLGELVLARYDALMQEFAGRFSGDLLSNTGRRDPFEFVLERMDGAPLRMADYRGKVIVADFWATWCGPCRLQGRLVERVAENFRADSDAAFLSVNVDLDRSGVPGFLKQEGWTLPAVYAQGLDQLLSVRELPTLVIFDRQGRIVYRVEGVNPDTFGQELDKHLRKTLQESMGR